MRTDMVNDEADQEELQDAVHRAELAICVQKGLEV